MLFVICGLPMKDVIAAQTREFIPWTADAKP